MSLSRKDGEQRLGAIAFTMPPGMEGMISQLTPCPEAQADAGTCPASSQIGHVKVQAGVGGQPDTLPEPGRQEDPVYLTESYKGAPFGIAVVVHAEAGPFNLGTVVVRGTIKVDPNTAQVSIATDATGPYAMPTILQGIPVDVQAIAIEVDRSQFMLNPTSCEPMSIAGTIGSAEGANAAVSSRFQAAGCTGLPFAPKLSASTSGKASKAGGASLVVKIASKPGEANIHKVNLQLPLQLPSRLSTLQKACTEAQFNINPAGCPGESVIGSGTAHTPILQVPLSGPAYLVSHGGAAFPDVEFVLQADERGGDVEIILDGGTQIKKGITYSNFETVPDAPISSFETVFPEGPHSIVTAYLPAGAKYNLCGQSLKMPTTITGQNGAVLRQSTPVAVTGCAPFIRVMKHKVKGNAATLVVSVPSAGKLTAKGAGLTSAARTVSAAKSVTLKLKLNRKEQAFLARHHHRKLKLRIKLQFAPKKGARLSSAVTVLIG
jgi:hypothetical protein